MISFLPCNAMDSTFGGVVHYDQTGVLTPLPLEEVRVNALVVDVSARVTIQQVFSNPSQTSTSRAKYVFPVPERAAVCAFEMRLSDGRVLIGVVKERTKASTEHEEALKKGKATALMEWASDDVFTISLGSIPGGESATIVLTYVMDLMDADSAQRVRLQIPMCVGKRYGAPPPGTENALGPSTQTRVRINATVQTKDQLRPENVVCPSHSSVSVAPYETHGRGSRHRVAVQYRSRRFLERDFVLQIQARGLDVSRCFAERDTRGTVAMQLTLMLKFELPAVQNQEYIFLVDRSYSMREKRIEIAKKTLVLLLRTLPPQGTSFNIFSFGTTCDGLWPTSQEYTQTSMETATTHVDHMDASYGDTEMRDALYVTMQSRNTSVPTVIFLLTDGRVTDSSSVITLVANTVQLSAPNAPLRVFTLGIGESTSTALCEGVARAGNGVCLLTTSSEGIIAKCAQLVRAGRSSLLKNITIDWGISPSPQSGDSDGTPGVRFTVQHQVVQQAPAQIDSIYRDFRLVVFALIDSDKWVPPKQITLRAQRDGSGEMLEFTIPVEQVKLERGATRHRLLHTLAARRLIMDMDSPKAAQTIPTDERIAAITRLGEMYQLASRYTSFVAVDGLPAHVLPRQRTRSNLSASSDSDDEEPGLLWYLQQTYDFATSAAIAFVSTWFGPPPVPAGSDTADQPPLDGQEPGSQTTEPAPPGQGSSGDDSDSAETLSTLSSFNSYSTWTETPMESRAPTPPPEDPEYIRSPSPAFGLPEPKVLGSTSGPTRAEVNPPPLEDSVMHLVRLQSWDGSFSPTSEFATLIGDAALQSQEGQNVDRKLWATVLAVAYFQKHIIGQPELLNGLVEKSLEYVESMRGSLSDRTTISSLLERARHLV